MKSIATIILLTIASLSFAAEAQPRRVHEMETSPGESKEAFVMRVATFLDGWTTSTGVEACGIIAEKDGAYSVILGTLDSQIQCDSNLVYTGWASTGETIHSHPPISASGKLRVTDRTREVANGALNGVAFVTPNRKQFSKGDYASGAGYVVDTGLLLYQRGVGTRQVVASVRNALPIGE